jgi:hypothetical protein
VGADRPRQGQEAEDKGECEWAHHLLSEIL